MKKKQLDLANEIVDEWVSKNGPVIDELIEVIRRDHETLREMVEPELRGDLREQLTLVARRTIAEEIAKSSGRPFLEIMIVLEDFDLKLRDDK